MPCRLLFLFLLSFFHASAQTVEEDAFAAKLFKEVVYALASDSMRGRATGSSEEAESLKYISSIFQQLTGKKLQSQTFTITIEDGAEIQATNGYAFINNKRKQTVVVSAHYDHIGLGGPLSNSLKDDEVHNGADDNASGVAVLLALAKELTKDKMAKHNYLIVFYSGHEIGLYGSKAFAEMVLNKRKYKSISTVVNLDMVGRMDPDLQKLKCMHSFNKTNVLDRINTADFSLKLNAVGPEKLLFLDTKYFYEAGIPCMSFTTGIHNDYHATTDDAQYISYDGMVKINAFIKAVLRQL